MLLGAYERKTFSLPSSFSELWGRGVLLATLKLEGDICIIVLIPTNLLKENQYSDFLFWGSAEIDDKGNIRMPRWIKRRLLRDINSTQGEMVIIGCWNRIEIWRRIDWERYQERYQDRHDYQKILERIFS